MSLEQALADNNRLLAELNANFTRLLAFSAPAAPETAEVKKAAKAAKKVEAEVAAQNAEAATAEAPTEENVAQPAPAVSYDDVKAHILDYAKQGKRSQVETTLAKYGVSKGPELKPEQYSDFIDALKKACA